MIEFDREKHAYYLDGVPLPSVTEIISGDKYDDIPTAILKRKADWGNRIHDWGETYALTGVRKHQSEMMKLSTDQAKRIIDRERIIIHSTEQIVYTDKYAGTYDMYGTRRGKTILIDIKTTYELDEHYLSLQLGMYKKAMESSGKTVEQCACLWLPKGRFAMLVDVDPASDEEIEWTVFKYEQEHNLGY